MMPCSAVSRVVLPAPFGPIKTVMPPSLIVRLIGPIMCFLQILIERSLAVMGNITNVPLVRFEPTNVLSNSQPGPRQLVQTLAPGPKQNPLLMFPAKSQWSRHGWHDQYCHQQS